MCADTKPEMTCCQPGYKCVPDAHAPTHYSNCQHTEVCTNARFGQCNGTDVNGHPWTKNYSHFDCCPEDFKCVYKNPHYSQCLWKNSTK